MDTYIFTIFFCLSALMSPTWSQSCEQAHYERCLKQLLQFTDKGDLIFATSANELQQECIQAQSAVGCLTRYSKKCLGLEERSKFTEGIAGPQKLTLGLCREEESDLGAKYLQSLPCLKNVSEGLQYCKEKYDRNQRDIILIDYEDKTHLQCCSFDGYKRCLRMLMETQEECRENTVDVVEEIATRLGGALAEDMCTEYFERCTGGGAAGIQTTISVLLLLLASLSSAFLAKYL